MDAPAYATSTILNTLVPESVNEYNGLFGWTNFIFLVLPLIFVNVRNGNVPV